MTLPTADPSSGELVLTNAAIRTVDPQNSVAEALLIRGGRIEAVGTESHVRAAAGPGVGSRDLGGLTVIPGIIDNHNHLSIAAFQPVSVDCTTPPLSSLAEVLGVIDESCRVLPPGQWAMGFGYFQGMVPEQRNPRRHDLDVVTHGCPFLLVDVSCHAAYANSAALAEAGISAHSPQPWGGLIEKDADGEPTGVLLEAAINTVLDAAWGDQVTRDWDRAVELVDAKLRDYLAVGVTAVGDALVTPRAAELYRRADAAGRLPIPVLQLHGGDYFFAAPDLRRADLLDRINASPSDRLLGGAMKIFYDRGFPDGPAIDQVHEGCTRHVGTAFYNRPDINDLVSRAARLGVDLAIHAMGNCAIDAVLDAYTDVRRTSGDERRLRIEHAFVADRRQAPRIASLGVELVVNPGLASHTGELFSSWRGEGQDHLRVLPVRTMLDAGVLVSFASDHPCGDFNPFEIMATAIERTTVTGTLVDPDEAVTPAEALRCFTASAARAAGRDDREGSIEVGKLANFALLDRDPITTAPAELRATIVRQTWVEGRPLLPDVVGATGN